MDEVIHPWLIRLCSVFLDRGMAYWPMPHRERGFYESVRTLLGRRGGIFPRYLTGLDEEFQRQEYFSFSAEDAVLDCLDTLCFREAGWEDALQSELLALPGWAGLIHQLEEEPGLAHDEAVPSSLMDFLAVRLTMVRVASRQGAAEPAEDSGEAASEPHRPRLRCSSRAVPLSRRSNRALRCRVGGFCRRGESLRWTGAPPHPPSGL